MFVDNWIELETWNFHQDPSHTDFLRIFHSSLSKMKRKEAGMSCRQFVLQQDVPLGEKPPMCHVRNSLSKLRIVSGERKEWWSECFRKVDTTISHVMSVLLSNCPHGISRNPKDGCKLDVCGSVHHSIIHIENPTRCNSVSKLYFTFIWSSTCFGRHTAYHQEPKLALAASGFAYVEGCWTCSCSTTLHVCKTRGC